MSEAPPTIFTVPNVGGHVPNVVGTTFGTFEIDSYEGPGKKELGFVEVVEMLQVRYDETPDSEVEYPQKGLWIYERDAKMRRHFKQHYPEFFAPRRDKIAARKRQEQQQEASRVQADRRRRGRSGKMEAVRSKIIDLSDHRHSSIS